MERRETRSKHREDTSRKAARVPVTTSERDRRVNARNQRKRKQVDEQNVDELNFEKQNIEQNVEQNVEEQNVEQHNVEEQHTRDNIGSSYARVPVTTTERDMRVYARKQSKKKQMEEQSVDELNFEKQNIEQNVEEQNVKEQNVGEHNVEEQHTGDDIGTSSARCNTQTSLGGPKIIDVISNYDTPIVSSIRNDKVYFKMSNSHTDTASCAANTPDSYAHPPSNDKKYSIIVDFEGAKGKDAGKWSSRCGALFRDHIPIGYTGWRLVDDFYKEKLWKELMKEFEMNIDPKLARPILEKKFSQYYRTMKSFLRTKYLRKDGQTIPKCDAIVNRPNDIDKIWWERFVDIEYSDKKQEQCMKNAENKAKHTIFHTLGRKSYCRVYEEMAMENPEQKLSRATAWKVGHKSKKTGEVLPCAAEKYALIEAAEEKRKLEAELNGRDGLASLEDLENDPVAEVFGSDKGKSFCRAVSSTSSVKRVKMILATKAIVDKNDKEELRICKEELQNQVNDAIKSVTSKFLNMQQNMLQVMQHNLLGSNMTPRTEVAPNTKHASVSSPIGNLVAPSNEVGSSLRERQYVSLLSRNIEEVAKGYLGTHSTCHHREVIENSERIVWVTEVINPEAPIFDGPQNGNYKLSDIADGGYVIWPLYRLRNL